MLQTSPQPDGAMAFLKHKLQTALDYPPLWRWLFCLSVLAILYLATTSQPYPIPSSASDKVNHLIAFIQLTVAMRLAWPQLHRARIALAMLAFGLAIELIQAWLPYREFSLLDLSADALGTAIGLLPCAFLFNPGKASRDYSRQSGT